MTLFTGNVYDIRKGVRQKIISNGMYIFVHVRGQIVGCTLTFAFSARLEEPCL